MKEIYLDYNATTPVDPAVADVMKPFIDKHFGNPSSGHSYGAESKKAVTKARKQIASLLGAETDEIIFTSGGTEANNMAIKGVAFANRSSGNHIISSKIEHPAVTEVCKYLEKNGFEVTYISVDEDGIIKLDELEKSIRPDTILITIMHANNETGSIQPISEISKIARQNNIILHTDAAQSAGKIDTDVNALGVDLLSLAGHKLYAPKGIGALYIRRGIKLEKLIHGADHEQNMRAGTENVIEIAGLGKACEIAGQSMKVNADHMKLLRDQLYDGIQKTFPEVKLNGHPEKRLPNTLNLSFPGLEANTLLLQMKGVAASAGAACHADNVNVSTVLAAMKIPVHFAMGSIRFSTGRYNTIAEIEKAVEIITRAVQKLAKHDDKVLTRDTKTIKLTQYTHGLGCACKIRPQYLERILKDLTPVNDPNVLVGQNTSDDAAVYRIDKSKAIVQTVDFFTPVVDDPFQFGAIAAANALSDIYAMGAKALFALNIVAFPDNSLPEEVLKQILKGAENKATEAGISILGGHTVEDSEPKFGMVVTGLAHPEKTWTNAGAKTGDVLLLTKKIGTGILSTALKNGLIENRSFESAVQSMMQLNKEAAETAATYKIHACTDITGFGLLGHLMEMTKASALTAEIQSEQIPLFDNVINLVSENVIPGGTKNNLDFVADQVAFGANISQAMKYILADAQTSGGLLFSLPEDDAEKLQKELHKKDITCQVIGRLREKQDNEIKIQ